MLSVCCFNLRVQLENVLDQVVKEVIDVLARLYHRLLDLDIVHCCLSQIELRLKLCMKLRASVFEVLQVMLLMSLSHAVVADELLILPAEISELHVIMNRTLELGRMQMKLRWLALVGLEIHKRG